MDKCSPQPVWSPEGCLSFSDAGGAVGVAGVSTLAAQPFALAVEELALLQSEALWPTPPQYMQRLLVK